MIQAVILSAGRGTRLNPITENLPKALLPIAGSTLIERTISTLFSSGVDHIIVGVGWLGHMIHSHISTMKRSKDILVVNAENYEEGPLQTFMAASSHLNEEKPFLILPADFILDKTIIDAVISSHLYGATPRIMTIGVDRASQIGATVHSDESDLISGLNLSKSSSAIGRCTMVIATNRGFLRYCDIAKQAGENRILSSINRMIAYNEPVRPAFVDGSWFDLDTIHDLLAANRYLLNEFTQHSAETIFVPSGDTIEISDRMNLAADIVVHPGVSLVGPLVISRESRIASNAIVGPYVSVGTGSSIGEECTISNSILFDSVVAPANRTLDGVVVHEGGIERS